MGIKAVDVTDRDQYGGKKIKGIGKSGGQKGRITEIALFVLVCSVPIFANVSFGATSSGSFLFVILLVALIPVLWLVHSLRTGRFDAGFNPTQIALLALLLLGLFQLLPLAGPGVPDGVLPGGASGALSLQPNSTRLAVIRLFVYLVFYSAALTFINSHSRIRKTAVTLLVFGSGMAFFAVLQSLSDPDVIYGLTPAAQAHPFGSYVNQHHFAAFLVMNLAIGVGLLVGGGTKRDKLVFLLIAVILMGTGVLFTGSRGAFLSLVAVLGFLAVAFFLLNRSDAKSGRSAIGRNSLKSALVFGGSAVGLILLLLLAAFLVGGDENALRGATMQGSADDFSTGRLHFWSVALKVFASHPITGAGLESFGVAYTQFDTGSGLYRPEFAHNEYLQMLADGGIIGLLIVLAFIFFLFWGGIRLIRSSKDRFRRSVAVGALAGCFGIVVHSAVDFPLRTSANMFFFLLFSALCLVKIPRK